MLSGARIALASLLASAALVFGAAHCCHAADAAPSLHDTTEMVAEAECAACFASTPKLAAEPARSTVAPGATVRALPGSRAESLPGQFHDRASPPRAPPGRIVLST